MALATSLIGERTAGSLTIELKHVGRLLTSIKAAALLVPCGSMLRAIIEIVEQIIDNFKNMRSCKASEDYLAQRVIGALMSIVRALQDRNQRDARQLKRDLHPLEKIMGDIGDFMKRQKEKNSLQRFMDAGSDLKKVMRLNSCLNDSLTQLQMKLMLDVDSGVRSIRSAQEKGHSEVMNELGQLKARMKKIETAPSIDRAVIKKKEVDSRERENRTSSREHRDRRHHEENKDSLVVARHSRKQTETLKGWTEYCEFGYASIASSSSSGYTIETSSWSKCETWSEGGRSSERRQHGSRLKKKHGDSKEKNTGTQEMQVIKTKESWTEADRSHRLKKQRDTRGRNKGTQPMQIITTKVGGINVVIRNRSTGSTSTNSSVSNVKYTWLP
ncbi:hypothetical protein SCHPADRAFT_940752 [Schizopora paradoxa]|uniref:Mixed lineage kinase domain-containing protein n=1 Tax=Schizopora paradoxa TaxID=27342 RepID=A0A0H2RM75_9AGAM|nr:hypothetical protein SCHPADRAFT_940752 [Schizopora paradoxa]